MRKSGTVGQWDGASVGRTEAEHRADDESMIRMGMECDRWMVLMCAILNQLAVDIGDRIRAGKGEEHPLVMALLGQSVPIFDYVYAWCPTCAYATPAGLLRLARWHARRSAKFVRDYSARRTASAELTGDEERTEWGKRRRCVSRTVGQWDSGAVREEALRS